MVRKHSGRYRSRHPGGPWRACHSTRVALILETTSSSRVVEKAKDPEIHLADWLEEGAPIGVARPYLQRGFSRSYH